MGVKARFDGQKMAEDMALRGWMRSDLAAAAGLTSKTVSAFLDGHIQTPKVALKLSVALGYSTRRYLIRQEAA